MSANPLNPIDSTRTATTTRLRSALPSFSPCTRASACSVLFNKLLTPHWVEAVGEEVAVSLNISHGGLRLRGELCRNERELEAWRGDHHHLT